MSAFYTMRSYGDNTAPRNNESRLDELGEWHTTEAMFDLRPQPRREGIMMLDTVDFGSETLNGARRKDSKALASSKLKKNWVLTPEALDKLLSYLDSDREVAGRKYENIRRKLIKYFECRGCIFPEEQADETIDRVARRLDEGIQIWTSEPVTFFYGVARNVLREYLAAPERQFSSLWDLPDPLDSYLCLSGFRETQNDRMMLEEKMQLLERSLKSLLPQSRELIIQYYQGEKQEKIRERKDMACRLGIPSNTLRIRVHRIRERLERQIMGCPK